MVEVVNETQRNQVAVIYSSRKQLQRALSLSSFESEETHSASEISIGDTTEDQHSMLSKSA